MSSKKIYADLIIKKKVVTPIDPLKKGGTSITIYGDVARICLGAPNFFYIYKFACCSMRFARGLGACSPEKMFKNYVI